jgi:hypothetical protein
MPVAPSRFGPSAAVDGDGAVRNGAANSAAAARRRHVPSAGSQQPYGRNHHYSSQSYRADEPGQWRRMSAGRQREGLRCCGAFTPTCVCGKGGPLGYSIMAGFAREEGRLVRLEADAFDALEKLVPCRRLAVANDVDIDDLSKQGIVKLTGSCAAFYNFVSVWRTYRLNFQGRKPGPRLEMLRAIRKST